MKLRESHFVIFPSRFKKMKTEEEHTDGDPMSPQFHSPTGAAALRPRGRGRGRPLGSKNKPRSPLSPSTSIEPPPTTMSPYVFELPHGADIIGSTLRFCRSRAISLCILAGNGAVSDVTLRQPSSPPSGAVTLRQASSPPSGAVTLYGRSDILSISATILPPGSALGATFTLSLATSRGEVVGGRVLGPLVAAGTIYLVAATFNNPSYHRLPDENNRDNPPEAGDDVIRAPVASAPPAPPQS